MLKIKTINGESKQGLSLPFICTAENGVEYYVKGRRSTRSSQINEWICGEIAINLGLPIAPFLMLDVSEELYEELTSKLEGIGKGACFASESQMNCRLLELKDINKIPLDLRLKVIAFDLLIRNDDRTIGNPNLLYHANDNRLIVIDHNLAFSKEFDTEKFLKNHIFASSLSNELNDLIIRQELEDFLEPSLQAYSIACNNLPLSWNWINEECDIPANYDFCFALNTLERLKHGQLWS